MVDFHVLLLKGIGIKVIQVVKAKEKGEKL